MRILSANPTVIATVGTSFTNPAALLVVAGYPVATIESILILRRTKAVANTETT
jgi:hypothetical protein